MSSPDSPADMRESVIVNPSAVGNPDETPVVFVGADLRAVLRPCSCGGLNGFHWDDCPEPSQWRQGDDGVWEPVSRTPGGSA